MKKAPSLAGRAILALLLMIGFYALAIGLCTVLGVLAWENANSRHVQGRFVLFAVVTIGIVLWSVLPRPVRFPDPGIRLRAEDQPELFALIRRTAEPAQQRMPAEVFLVSDVNAFVAERGSILGFFGTRVLGLGLPLLQTLTVSQLRSVIAHEFGHFHGGDTRLGPLIYRTRDAIGRTIVNFQRAASLLQKPFEWYGNLFLRVTFAISRRQEFAADALSVRIVGREPVQTALRRVNEVGPLWDHYLQNEFAPALDHAARPPLAQGFQLFLGSPAMRKVQVLIGEEAMQAKGNPFDSHPPLSERLAAADDVENAGTERVAGPSAITLLREVDALERDLLVFMTGKPEVAQIPGRPWSEAAVTTVLAIWHRFAKEHAHRLPALTVAQLAGEREAFPRHAVCVNSGIPAAEQRAAAAWMFGTLLARALLRAGFTAETGPGEPVVLVDGTRPLDPFALTTAVADGQLDAAAWADLCREHGIGDHFLSGPLAVPT